MEGLGRHYEVSVTCRGKPDPVTGYFLAIQEIDRAARQTLVPDISRACHETPHAQPAHLLARALPALDGALGGRLASVRWFLSPTYSVEVTKGTPQHAVLRQRFEFAAAHRLNVAALTPEQNRATFGKCNLPSAHGHNYVLEPAVLLHAVGEGAGAASGARGFGLSDLEVVVESAVLKQFDHRHLNLDTPQFADLNPSVENIARVCYELLAPAVAAASRGRATLRDVTVWETEKTSCTYPG